MGEQRCLRVGCRHHSGGLERTDHLKHGGGDGNRVCDGSLVQVGSELCDCKTHILGQIQGSDRPPLCY